MLYVIGKSGDKLSRLGSYIVWDSDDLTVEKSNGGEIKKLYDHSPSLFGNLKGMKSRFGTQVYIKDYVGVKKYRKPAMSDNCIGWIVPIKGGSELGYWFGGAFHTDGKVANKALTANMPVVIKDGMVFVIDYVYGQIPVTFMSSMQMPYEIFYSQYIQK